MNGLDSALLITFALNAAIVVNGGPIEYYSATPYSAKEGNRRMLNNYFIRKQNNFYLKRGSDPHKTGYNNDENSGDEVIESNNYLVPKPVVSSEEYDDIKNHINFYLTTTESISKPAESTKRKIYYTNLNDFSPEDKSNSDKVGDLDNVSTIYSVPVSTTTASIKTGLRVNGLTATTEKYNKNNNFMNGSLQTTSKVSPSTNQTNASDIVGSDQIKRSDNLPVMEEYSDSQEHSDELLKLLRYGTLPATKTSITDAINTTTDFALVTEKYSKSDKQNDTILHLPNTTSVILQRTKTNTTDIITIIPDVPPITDDYSYSNEHSDELFQLLKSGSQPITKTEIAEIISTKSNYAQGTEKYSDSDKHSSKLLHLTNTSNMPLLTTKTNTSNIAFPSITENYSDSDEYIEFSDEITQTATKKSRRRNKSLAFNLRQSTAEKPNQNTSETASIPSREGLNSTGIEMRNGTVLSTGDKQNEVVLVLWL